MARAAARLPAASPSKQRTGCGDRHHSSASCSAVRAVPSGATLVYTHSLFPGWGTIVRDGERYRWIGG